MYLQVFRKKIKNYGRSRDLNTLRVGCSTAVPSHICNTQASNDFADEFARHGPNQKNEKKTGTTEMKILLSK